MQAEFAKLLRDDPRVDAGVRGFLGRAYHLKTLADYELEAPDVLARARVEAAVLGAGRVIAAVEAMLRDD